MSNSTNIYDLPVAKENIQMTINDPGQMQQQQPKSQLTARRFEIGEVAEAQAKALFLALLVLPKLLGKSSLSSTENSLAWRSESQHLMFQSLI